ncbi:MAG: hypothetical protein HY909_06340 [Deltaproteobacteria bacterium]|nr:hypothetical protein [Deltaproteobacteria bacterium]
MTVVAGQTVVGTVLWSVPAAVGTHTVTCTVADDGVGGSFGPRTGTLSVPVNAVTPVGAVPVLDSLLATASRVQVGGTVQLTAVAHDDDGDALTYAWASSTGSVVGSGGSATWTAPGVAGGATVTVVVSDGNGNSASGTVAVDVRLALYAGSLPSAVTSPLRVAVAPDGDFYTVDAMGQLALLTPRGHLKGVFTAPEVVLAVTRCWGDVVVSGISGRVYRLDGVGRVKGEVVLAGGRAAWPAGLSCDEVTGLLFVAERNAGRVRAVRADGSTAYALTSAGSDGLEAPVDVAVDGSTRRLWVLLQSYQGGTRNQLHGYLLDGTYVSSMAQYGGATGNLTRGSGLAASGGRVVASDAFQSTVQVFSGAGVSLGELGGFGTGPGELRQPAGVVVTGNGNVVVADTGNNRVDVFGQPLPPCPGDADCDGLPDAWEVANGFNPNDARDALSDVDGDGLVNVEEYAWGANPRNRDTDGDGYGDGEEVAAGLSPVDATDHVPQLVVKSTVVSGPGLLRLDTVLQGRGTCSVSWVQTGGPTATLREATSGAPAFVGREAGSYVFEGTPTCGAATGTTRVAQAVVEEVAPRAEAGRVVVAKAGESVLLEGGFSWDGNGGALGYEWGQVLGPPRLGPTASPGVWTRAWDVGLYVYQLTVRDGAGREGTAEAPVLVVEEGRQAPTAVVESPLLGVVGSAVALDASESVGPPGVALRYAWRQVSGPTATLQGKAGAARVGFVPRSAGHYRFEVSAAEGKQTSPWARVDVYVAATSSGLPVATAPATRRGTVGQPVSLPGVRSQAVEKGSLEYRWRQVSGAAAGLTEETKATATVVPFAAGVSVFELQVLQEGMASVPARVVVEAEAPGQARPQAVAAGPAVATAKAEVLLDGSASRGTAGGRLGYRWTQVAGPWVALDDARGALAGFTPLLPGLYVFELEVEDGTVRSAPSTVGVLVFPASAGGRP